MTRHPVPSCLTRRAKRRAKPLPEPTAALPGTPQKVEALRMRVEEFERGKISSIYHPLDGRIDDHVGQTLFTHRNGATLLDALLAQDGLPDDEDANED